MSDGIALVDTGLNMPPAREAWEALFAGPLAGRAVTRVICTHFHPDHLGLAGWLTERFGVRLWMTRGEWLFARMLTSDVRDAPPPEAVGLSARRRLERGADRGGGGQGLGPLRGDGEPGAGRLCADAGRRRDRDRRADLAGGDRQRPFARTCLPGRRGRQADDRRRPGAAADHLQRLAEPQRARGRPARRMAGLDREAEAAARRPPRPPLARRAVHRPPRPPRCARRTAIAAASTRSTPISPSRAARSTASSVLFGRQIDDGSLGLATGEAMAHLRHLEVEGRAVREVRDGVHWYRAASA